jgi:transposase-like protein
MYTGEGFKMVEGSDDVKVVLKGRLKLQNETSFLGGRYRHCIALYETKLSVKGVYVYVWSAVDMDSGETLAIYASWSRNMLIAMMKFLRMVLGRCINKPLIIVDRGPWYMWALERLGLEYRYERFGMRNRVERFFRYLKERTIVFHHKLSARNHIQGITNLKQFLSPFTIYY